MRGPFRAPAFFMKRYVQRVLIPVASGASDPPVALGVGPYAGLHGEEMAFDGSGSHDSDGGSSPIFQWNFEDGAIAGYYLEFFQIAIFDELSRCFEQDLA